MTSRDFWRGAAIAGAWILAQPGRMWRAAFAVAPLRIWALVLGAPAMTALAVHLVRVITAPTWPAELRDEQLSAAKWALFIILGIILVIVAAIAAVKVKWTGPGGISGEVEPDEGPPV